MVAARCMICCHDTERVSVCKRTVLAASWRPSVLDGLFASVPMLELVGSAVHVAHLLLCAVLLSLDPS